MPVLPSWPYPAFGTTGWLAGGQDDPALAAVRTALLTTLRSRGQSPGSAEVLVEGLRALVDLGERLDWAMLALIGEGRSAGLSWGELAEGLGVSRQAAQQRFAAWVEQAHEQARGQVPEPQS